MERKHKNRKRRKARPRHMIQIGGRAFQLLGKLLNAEELVPLRTYKFQLEQAITAMAVKKGIITKEDAA